MSYPSSEIVKADFDRLAQFETGAEGWNHNTHYHPFLLRQLPPRLERALEIGCGAGGFARLLAQRADHVAALDLSPEMLRLARERSTAYPNIDYIEADVMTYPLEEAQFDALVSIATLHHLPFTDVIQQIKPALKPGGTLLILDLFSQSGWGETPVDLAMNAAAMILSPLMRLRYGISPRPSAEQRAAWDAHGAHDVYPKLSDLRAWCADLLPGARLTRHLFWRYSLVWRKPA